MSSKHLELVHGDRQGQRHCNGQRNVGDAVHAAIRNGFRVGRRVRIGRVAGQVVGYNIGTFGRFCGASYPLLVSTAFGLAKCSLREVDWFD